MKREISVVSYIAYIKFMKNIFRIYKRDIKKIVTNWVLLVVVLGLIILPPLYAWFNIEASWDPYGSTSGIKVAIVNKDLGANIEEKEINVGERLVGELKNNTQLGWKFVSEEEAQKGVEEGKFYASIIIPEDFTQNTISFIKKDINKPELIYTVNEKKNAIAPKITDKGVSSLKSQIDATIVKTVDGIIFKTLNEVGIGVEELRPTLRRVVDMIIQLDENMPEIEQIIDKGYDGTGIAKDLIPEIKEQIPLTKETLEKTSGVLSNSKDFLNGFKEDFDTISPIVKESLQNASDLLTAGEDLLNNIPQLKPNDVVIILEQLSSKISLGQGKIDTVIGFLKPLAIVKPELKDVVSKLEDMSVKLQNLNNEIIQIKNEVDSTNKLPGAEKLENIKQNLASLNGVAKNILEKYDSELVPFISEANTDLNTIIENTLTLINNAEDKIPEVEKLLDDLYTAITLGNDQIGELKEDMPFIKEKVEKLASIVKELPDDDKIDFIVSAITNNWEKQASFLSSPVEVKENKLFSIPNYGSAMSPFFSTLSLWVGALILASILSVEPEPFEDKGEIKAYEKYFGKYLTFATIGILQGLLVTIGDILILKTYVVNKPVFVFLGVFISLVFMIIVYTLVSVFGNVGKALGVILLVLQISGAGGTFPIEVTPKFFQGINPLLPFTYAISSMREAVGGIVTSVLIKDLLVLLIYFVIFVILGIVLKKPINNLSKGLVKKLKEGGIIGH